MTNYFSLGIELLYPVPRYHFRVYCEGCEQLHPRDEMADSGLCVECEANRKMEQRREREEQEEEL